MHQNGTTISRRSGTVLAATAAAIAVLAPTASAGVEAHPTKASAEAHELTPAEYVKFLEGQDDTEAKEGLKTFKALSLAEQTKFVGYLQDADVFKAFTDSAGSQGAGSPEGTTVTKYNKDVTFINEAKITREKESPTGVSTRVAHWNEKATYSFKMKLMGFTVTKMQVWVRYQSTRGAVTKVYNSGSALKNYNAGVSIEGENARPWKSGGYAHAETIWKGNMVYKGFGVRVDKKQKLKAEYNGDWTGSVKNV